MMNLDNFVSQVLINIESGLTTAKTETNKRYTIQTSANSGISFDIAVTTTNTEDASSQGKLNAGVIQVLGAGLERSEGTKKESSEVSRIKFTVIVPSQTISEEWIGPIEQK